LNEGFNYSISNKKGKTMIIQKLLKDKVCFVTMVICAAGSLAGVGINSLMFVSVGNLEPFPAVVVAATFMIGYVIVMRIGLKLLNEAVEKKQEEAIASVENVVENLQDRLKKYEWFNKTLADAEADVDSDVINIIPEILLPGHFPKHTNKKETLDDRTLPSELQ
jgi:hypothetical protein